MKKLKPKTNSIIVMFLIVGFILTACAVIPIKVDKSQNERNTGKVPILNRF